jgi:hypothetical protein
MHDLAELFREAASQGFVIMVPPAQQLGASNNWLPFRAV